LNADISVNKSIKPLTTCFYQNKFDSYAFESQTSRWKIKAIKWFISADGVFSISILISSVLHRTKEGGRAFFVHLSSGWAAAKPITCVHLSVLICLCGFCLCLILSFHYKIDFVFLCWRNECWFASANPAASVLVARTLPVYPCAGYFDKHDISYQLVHNIYIELSHTELQKSPITHSLPAVVKTTKAFYFWSWFDQALEGITVHCMTRLSGVFSCFVIQNFVLFQQKGKLKDVSNFQIVLFIHIRSQTKMCTCNTVYFTWGLLEWALDRFIWWKDWI